MSTVEEIERAVEQLPPEDIARLAAWLETRHAAWREGQSLNTDWFEVYMACPQPFEIPPRKKEFYKPKSRRSLVLKTQ